MDGKGKVLSCRMLSQGQADMTVLSLRQAVENAPSYPGCGIQIAEKATLDALIERITEEK